MGCEEAGGLWGVGPGLGRSGEAVHLRPQEVLLLCSLDRWGSIRQGTFPPPVLSLPSLSPPQFSTPFSNHH